MSGSRWTYRTANAEADGNSVKVRGLTNGERSQFVELNKRRAAGEISAAELPGLVAKMGCIEVSDNDLADMPVALVGAAVDKIMELSGLGAADEKKDGPPAA